MNRHLAAIHRSPRAALACERVSAVISGTRPDRVPFTDSYWPEFRTRYLRERGLPADASLTERFDHDATVLAPVMGPWPSEACELGRDRQGRVLRRDDFGLVTRNMPGVTTMCQQVEPKIKERRDLDRFPFEDPRAESRTAAMARALPDVCKRFCPVLKLGGPFSRTWRVRGIESFLEDLARDEPFAQDMVARMTDHLIAVGTCAVERLEFPAILLHIADDFASTSGPLFSPRTYESVFLPNLRKMVAAFHDRGFKVSYESEGNIWPMLELLDESGVDGLANMEPRAGMRIGRIRERFGSRFFLWGNICNVEVLPSGSRDAVRREVHRVLSSATDGGYMGLSAHSIAPDVASDTYDYFWALMDRYARYPIQVQALCGSQDQEEPSSTETS